MGAPNVDRMLEGMPALMLSEWMAFAAVEPFGEERNDYRLAFALAVIINMFRGKDAQPVTPKDLMPTVGILADEFAPAQHDAPVQPRKHPSVAMFEEAYSAWAQ